MNIVTENYSAEMVEKLETYRDVGIDWETANQLGAEMGRKAMSVVQKAKTLGITYRAKERAEAKGVVQKKVYVKSIETALGVTLMSADKMTKVDLVKLDEAIKALVG